MITGLQSVRDSAVEFTLRLMAPQPFASNAAWTVTADELRSTTIRWPETYQWPSARYWVDTILSGLRGRVNVEMVPLAQPYRGIVVFQFARGGCRADAVIDYSDYPDINREAADRCEIYFKMQHLREGYGRANVLPGGYVCDGRKIYLHLPRLRRFRDRGDFKFDVYGRFGTEFAGDIRRQAVGMLSAQNLFRFEGGLEKVKYLDFLKEIAQAKVCIDLPGEGDFCFRLMNYLAIGACVVGPRPRTTLHMPLVDRVHVAYTNDDLSNLVELCRFYVENDEAREAMCQESRRFFEQYLHKDNLTSYYLRSCLDRAM